MIQNQDQESGLTDPPGARGGLSSSYLGQERKQGAKDEHKLRALAVYQIFPSIAGLDAFTTTASKYNEDAEELVHPDVITWKDSERTSSGGGGRNNRHNHKKEKEAELCSRQKEKAKEVRWFDS